MRYPLAMRLRHRHHACLLASLTFLTPCFVVNHELVAQTPPLAATSLESTERFHAYIDGYEAWRLVVNPEYALKRGFRDRAGELTDTTVAGVHQRQSAMVNFLNEFRAIDAAALSPVDRLDYDLLVRELTLSDEGFRFNSWHRLQGENRLPTRQTSQATNMGKKLLLL